MQGAVLDDPEFLRHIVEGVLQHLLEAGITGHLGAPPTKVAKAVKARQRLRAEEAQGQRVGTLELLVPQDLKEGSSPRACSLATNETRRRLPWH